MLRWAADRPPGYEALGREEIVVRLGPLPAINLPSPPEWRAAILFLAAAPFFAAAFAAGPVSTEPAPPEPRPGDSVRVEPEDSVRAEPADPAEADPPPLPETAPEEVPPFPRPEDIPPLEATVVVPDFGEFTIRFYRAEAPNHVAHFLTLAHEGFYDGLAFHRAIPGYVIQTGDPSGRDDDPWNDGQGGPFYRLPAEKTPTTHIRGTVSMSWREDREGTAGSQWCVTLADLPALDERATAIGRVVEGMDAVDRISQVTTLRNRSPRVPVRIERVTLRREGAPVVAPSRIVESGGTESAPPEGD